MYENQVVASKAAAAGLTKTEAQERLREFGPNRVEGEPRHALFALFGKLRAPVPWMREVTILLEILVHKLDKCRVTHPARR
jgi:H+-transporting ATPase